jgi:hypothetical protein
MGQQTEWRLNATAAQGPRLDLHADLVDADHEVRDEEHRRDAAATS